MLDTMRFPVKLYNLLETASNDARLCKIIGWLPCGDAFVIRDASAFTELVLPIHFARMHSFKSFRRQLNLYGVKKRALRMMTSESKHDLEFVRNLEGEYSTTQLRRSWLVVDCTEFL